MTLNCAMILGENAVVIGKMGCKWDIYWNFMELNEICEWMTRL